MHCLPQRQKSMLFEIFSNGGCPKGTRSEKKFQTTLILALEANSTLSCQNALFPHFSSLCISFCNNFFQKVQKDEVSPFFSYSDKIAVVFKLAKRNALQKGKYNLQNNKRVVKDGCCLWLLLPPNKKTLLLPSSPKKMQ